MILKKVISLLVCVGLIVGCTSFYALATGTENNVSPTVEVSENYVAALDNSGVVWTWALNSNDVTSSSFPTAVNSASSLKFTAISAGYDHMLALSDDGRVYAWGSNACGQLGCDPNVQNLQTTTTPTPVGGALEDKTVVDIAASDCVSLALLADGSVYSWGDYSDGLLGIENKNGQANAVTPKQIETLRGIFIVDLFASNSVAAALAADGNIYLWGKNNKLQTGNAQNPSITLVPTQASVANGFLITDITFGLYHSSFLSKNGMIGNIGANNAGQFGNSSCEIAETPFYSQIGITQTNTQNPTDVLFCDIAAGTDHMLALSSDGDIYAWGNLNNAQLGNVAYNGTYDAPEEVLYFSDIVIIGIDSCGTTCAAIDGSGFVYLWGEPYQTPQRVIKENTDPLCLGSAPSNIVQNAYVTATAVIPAPTYTVSIPATLGANDLMQSSTVSNRSIPFTISVSNVDNLFGEQQVEVAISTESGEFILINEAESHQLIYQVYKNATGGTPLSSGDVIAVFTESATTSVSGRIEIDQSQIVYTDEYFGTLIFDISLVPTGEED